MLRKLLAVALLLPLPVFSDLPSEPPVLRALQPIVTMLDATSKKVQITLQATILQAGDVTLKMTIPSQVLKRKENSTVQLEYSQEGLAESSTLSQSFSIFLPEKGHFMIPFQYLWEEGTESRPGSIPIYVTMKNSRLVSRTDYFVPDPAYTTAPVKVFLRLPLTRGIYTINVKISGRVYYSDDFGPGGSFGVPGVKVHLDWDKDQDPETLQAPPHSPRGAAVTNSEGFYKYDFTISSPIPASFYPRIRVYADLGNSAAYPTTRKGESRLGDNFSNEYFVTLSENDPDTFISSEANIDADSPHGIPLRYLYRAREFAKENLGHTPARVAYFAVPANEAGGSLFCYSNAPDECDYRKSPTVVLNTRARSMVSYHEYGHYLEQSILGGPFPYYPERGQKHNYYELTTDTVAWSEGFAEFFSAACHMYFYSKESPGSPERNPRYERSIVNEDNGPWSWEFLDFSQDSIPDSDDLTISEAAIACLLFSLWDGVEERAPGYSGDNDDLTISGATILDAVIARRSSNPSGTLIGGTSINSFRLGLRALMSEPELSSLETLYDWYIMGEDSARPATSTTLQVSGNYESRTLFWNDNTSPDRFTWSGDGFSFIFDIVENNETGFKIYRKQGDTTTDRLVGNYTEVGSVGSDVTTWIDPSVLEAGTYTYLVTAYGDGGVSAPRTLQAITIQDPPPISITGRDEITVQENTTAPLGQYTAVSLGTVEWLPLSGDDKDFFSKDQVGENVKLRSLSFNSPPDYEFPGDVGRDNTYDVTLEARIEGTTTKATFSVEIEVEDVQDTDRLGTLAFTNADPPRVNQEITATLEDLDDPQLDSATWSWTDTPDEDNTFTPTIQGIGSTLTVTVVYTDDYGSHTLSKSTSEVEPSQSLPGTPGNFEADPGDGQVTLTWTTAAHNGSPITQYQYAHQLSSAEGDPSNWTTAPSSNGKLPDARTVTVTPLTNNLSYDFAVRSHNGNGSSTPATDSATPVPDNSGPTLSCPATKTLPENGSSPWIVGTCTASDPDGDVLAWSLLGDQKDYFKLTGSGDSRQLEFKSNPNHEHRETYAVEVEVTDPSGLSAQVSTTVTVSDVNEAPSVTCDPVSFSTPENGSSPWTVTSCEASDPDDNDTISWDLTGSQRSYFKFSGSGNSRDVVFRSKPNHETRESYSFAVKVTDSGSLSNSSAIAVTVSDVNEAPDATGPSTFTTKENSSNLVVGTYSVADPDAGDSHTWTLSGVQEDYFEFDDDNLELSFKKKANYEDRSTYSVTVTATDRGGLSDRVTTTVTVTDVNEAPTVTCPDTKSIPENGSSPWLVVECSASDPEDDTLSWTLSNTHHSYFKFSGTGNTRHVRFRANPNHEHRETYNVNVNVEDPDGLTDVESIVVTVMDVNEAPTVTGISSRSIPENGRPPWSIASYAASDPDDGDSITFDLSGNQEGYFKITGSGNTQQLEFENYPDHEHRETYSVRVEVEDNDGLGDYVDVTVTVTDVNEAPTVTGPSDPTIPERSKLVGTYTASDPDENDTISWSLTGDDASSFVRKSPAVMPGWRQELHFDITTDFDGKNPYSVSVKVTDSGGLFDTQPVSVSLSNVDDIPTLWVTPPSPKVGETVTATLTDTDGGVDNLTWVWAFEDVAAASSENFSSDESERTLSQKQDTSDPIPDTKVGQVLRVTVSYDDAQGPDKSATKTTSAVKANKPGAVGSLTASRSDQTVSLSWTAAPSNGAPIDRYEYLRSGSGSSWTTVSGGGEARSVTISSLTNGVESLLSGYKWNKVNWLQRCSDWYWALTLVSNCKISTFSNRETVRICRISARRRSTCSCFLTMATST